MEIVEITGRLKVDSDGYPIGMGDTRTVGAVVEPVTVEEVGPVGAEGVNEFLRLYLPGGASVGRGDTVMVRGEAFEVVKAPFDHSVGRVPVNGRHRPRVVAIVARGEG